MPSGRRSSRCSRPAPDPPAGLSSAPGTGPALLPGDLDPAGDRRLLGRHRSDPRPPGVRHHPARPPGRVDRRRVFEQVKVEALAAFDRIVGLDLDDVVVDGSLHKAPYGGEGTGPNPTDRAKLGWKWSVASERHGIPVGWAIDGANRNDVRMLEPTLDAVSDAGLLDDIGVLHLDRSYDSPAVRDRLLAVGIDQFEIQRRGTELPDVKRQPLRLGLRRVVEATNTWWSNYGQLRRNTDRRARHRHAALCLATAILIIGRLIDWRNRWSPT